MAAQDLLKLTCLDCDSNGTLYGVCQSGEEPPTIVAIDARHEVLGRSSIQGDKTQAGIPVSQLHVATVLKPSTLIDFSIKMVSASHNGHYLLLVGHQGEDYAAAAVLDIYGGRLVTPSHAPPGPLAKPSTSESATAASVTPALRVKECSLHPVDPQLYQSRPGLLIYQASWHPHSGAHLALLTSDSHWRLYGLDDLSLAEQSFDLRACLAAPVPPSLPAGAAATPGARSTPGTPFPLASPQRASPLPTPGRFGLLSRAEGLHSVTAFAFGPPVSWGYFTVLFLTSSGAVYALCPVCPFGMRVPTSVLKHAMQFSSGDEQGTRWGSSGGGAGAEEGGASAALAAWLKAAFAVNVLDEGVDGKQRWIGQRHVHEGASPSLQGPLNAAGDSLSSDPRCPAVALHTSYQLELSSSGSSDSFLTGGASETSGLPARCVTSCVVTGFADGRLYAHVCHGLLGPCWREAEPQCVLDVRGDVRAARYQCHATPLPSSSSSSAPAASPSPSPSTPAGLSPSSLSPPCCGALLLLDLIDLQLPTATSSASALGAAADSDDEDLLGDGGAMGRVLGPDAGSRRLALLGSQDAPSSLWALHESGAWALTLPWLPALSAALAGTSTSTPAAGTTGARTSASSFASDDDPSLAMGRLQLALDTVAPPTLRELARCPAALDGGPWLAGGAVLPDLFLGDSLLALRMPGVVAAPPGSRPAGQQQRQPAMCCFRLRAPVADEDAAAGAAEGEAGGAAASEAASGRAAGSASTAAGADGGAAVTAEPGGLGSPSARSGGSTSDVAASLPGPRRELLDANIRAMYGELVRGWSKLELPKPSGPTGSQDPEGAAYLSECIALMRQHHIEYIHRADQEIRQRMAALGQEVPAHRAAMTELQQLLSTSQRRQASLSERCARVVELQRNLLERSDLLAQLHWSLPRPLSDAERELDAELGALTARAQAAAAQWGQLRRRADAALGSAGAGGPPQTAATAAAAAAAAGAGSAAGLPAAQAAKVHAAILEQFRLISGTMHQLKQMEADLQQFKLSGKDE